MNLPVPFFTAGTEGKARAYKETVIQKHVQVVLGKWSVLHGLLPREFYFLASPLVPLENTVSRAWSVFQESMEGRQCFMITPNYYSEVVLHSKTALCLHLFKK